MKNKLLAVIIVVILAAVAGGVVWHLLSQLSAARGGAAADGEQVHRVELPTIEYGGKSYTLNDDLETILCIGLDGTQEEVSYNNQVQSDFATLVVLNHAKGTVRLVQLNRDTLVDMPVLDVQGNEAGTATGQLALAHTYGSGSRDSCRNVVKTVSNLLYGIKIDHFMSISTASIGPLNDLVGGVEVTIEDDFSAYDKSMAMGKTMVLNGDQAELFVRSRQSLPDSTNVNRMARQRQYMKNWISKASEALEEDAGILDEGLMKISDDLVSDMTIYDLADLCESVINYDFEGTVTPEGKSYEKDGHMAFDVEEDALRKLVVEEFYR